jgi:acyl dehydratase
MVVNIGLNQVRFPYPVKSDNRIRAVSTLSKVTPIRKGLEIEREIKVEIDGVRRPGAVVTSVIQLHF